MNPKFTLREFTDKEISQVSSSVVQVLSAIGSFLTRRKVYSIAQCFRRRSFSMQGLHHGTLWSKK